MDIQKDIDTNDAQEFMKNLKNMQHTPVQEVMIKELLEVSEENEMVQALEFIRQNGVPLTSDQVAGTFQLIDAGITDVFTYVNSARKLMTPVNKLFRLIDKLTLADRIKGNAKLSNLLKANANPANSISGVPMSIEKGSRS
ncbi:hypothetical protein [Bacillus sp. FJAT-27264]|uniref:hypothetical protein n=1 Tax=Paenibacillus sp. (strain DSM 101736 / FJAT-27264) TaxID=1850362 RepID=UPI0009F39910|nr:hypothetical protein [Bacillus sp. FJAT-27264]